MVSVVKLTNILLDIFCTVAYRLVDGSRTAGRLEISINGQWGTVCDDQWNGIQGNLNAQVACKSLGLPWRSAYPVPEAGYGQGSSSLPILMDDVQCRGTESSLFSCPRRASGNDCYHAEDVGRSWCCTHTLFQPPCLFNLPFYLRCCLQRLKEEEEEYSWKGGSRSLGWGEARLQGKHIAWVTYFLWFLILF